ncbi:MAG: FIST C-terminal domain-containing protein [Treponema sp.]|jgi:hypothetical protein|nr:FIST C-terminal domain-containing protein [Treponema sp.]
MKSAVAMSYELDDPEKAAEQLVLSIKDKLSIQKNSAGILFCDADTDGAALTGALKARLGFEISGMTSLAVLENSGHHEGALVLLVFSADDAAFRAVVSEPLSGEGREKRLEKTVGECAAACDGYGTKPALVFAFCPSGMPFSGDKYPDLFSKFLENVPIMGGVCSDDYNYDQTRVFFSGKEYKDSLVLLSLWGNIKPAFALRHVTSRFAERTRRVTQAEDNKVYRVGDETFVRYLEGFGLKTDVDDPLLAFTSYPMMLTRDGKNETPLMRHIAALNREDGSGTFLGDVPAGALANICLITKDDIMASCRESMNSLLAEAEKQKDYEYSAILCISCCGRAMILGKDAAAEGNILSGMLPSNFSLAGAYCLGEISPTHYSENNVSNRFHNCSIAFCMI